MKKKLIISLMVALVMVLVPTSVAFAWEYEDTKVADNEDFVRGSGYDNDAKGTPDYVQAHWGGQFPPGGDGVNLYRDEGSGLGDLDGISSIWSLSPENIDLPFGDVWSFGGETGAWFSDGSPDISSNAWYWALEPGVYNLPSVSPPIVSAESPYLGLEGQLVVEVFKYRYHDTYSWAGHWNEFPQVLGEAVNITGVSNGTTCTLEIPEGTQVSFPYRSGVLVTSLFLDLVDGDITFSPKDADFSQPSTITIATPAGSEVITFTEIRGGLPVLD